MQARKASGYMVPVIKGFYAAPAGIPFRAVNLCSKWLRNNGLDEAHGGGGSTAAPSRRPPSHQILSIFGGVRTRYSEPIFVKRASILVILIALSLAGALDVAGQGNRLIPVDDWSYAYIERLQHRGHLLELNPTALPYTEGEVAASLERVRERRLQGPERQWFRLLERRFKTRRTRRGTAVVGGWLEAGSAVTNNDRLEPLRFTDGGEPTIEVGDARIYPRATLQIYLDRQPFVAELGLRHDVFYDVDPDGLDAVNRLYVRNEHAYVGLNTRYVSLYAGRFANHWAPVGSPGVLISRNPRSYDQLHVRIGSERLALRSILGELDAATAEGAFTGRAADDRSRPGINRFLAAHRLDWRPNKSLAFSLSESVLYSGQGASPSIKLFSPVHVYLFLVDNRPKNEEHNGFLAASAWGRWRSATLSGQLLLDDFDFLNGSEPASIAAVGDLTVAPKPWLHLGASTHAVAALTYNTHQPEGRYLYMLRGIATEFTDFIHASGFLRFFPASVPALSLEPRLQLLWQGESDVMDPFPLEPSREETILRGTVERTLRLAARIRYQPDARFWVGLDVGVNQVQNAGHFAGRDETRLVGLLEFGARLSLSERYRLRF